MWTHRVPPLLIPSPRTRNSGNAVCKKRIIPSMSRTQRFACSSRTVIATSHAWVLFGPPAQIAVAGGPRITLTRTYSRGTRFHELHVHAGHIPVVLSAHRTLCRYCRDNPQLLCFQG